MLGLLDTFESIYCGAKKLKLLLFDDWLLILVLLLLLLIFCIAVTPFSALLKKSLFVFVFEIPLLGFPIRLFFLMLLLINDLGLSFYSFFPLNFYCNFINY